MENGKTSVIVPALWVFSTICWVIAFCADLYYQESPDYLIVMHALCAIVSLAAAIINYHRYKVSNSHEK